MTSGLITEPIAVSWSSQPLRSSWIQPKKYSIWSTTDLMGWVQSRAYDILDLNTIMTNHNDDYDDDNNNNHNNNNEITITAPHPHTHTRVARERICIIGPAMQFFLLFFLARCATCLIGGKH